jgi:hypothetical protein
MMVVEGYRTSTGEYVIGEYYQLDVHGHPPISSGSHWYGAPPDIIKRPPPVEKEPLGEWELCPWKPGDVIVYDH